MFSIKTITAMLHIQIMVLKTTLRVKHFNDNAMRASSLTSSMASIVGKPTEQAHACCRLEGIDYVRTFDELRKKHDQNNESVPTAFVT